MRGVSILTFLIGLIFIQPTHALECSGVFNSFHVSNSVQNLFWEKTFKQVKDKRLVQVIEKIKTWSKNEKTIDLNIQLGQVASKDRLITLLYLLSSTRTGRKIIEKNIKKIKSFIIVEVRSIQDIGYFEMIDDNGVSRLKLNKNLKLGTAVLVFGHELTHAYDFLSSKSYRKVSQDEKMLVTEYNAYLNEKLMIHELLKTEKFKRYLESVRDDELNNLYTQNLDAKVFAKSMESSDNIPVSDTLEFLAKQKRPNFEVD